MLGQPDRNVGGGVGVGSTIYYRLLLQYIFLDTLSIFFGVFT